MATLPNLLRSTLFGSLISICFLWAATPVHACNASPAEFEAALQAYLDARNEAEGITGIVLHAECGAGGTAVDAAVGTMGRDDPRPMTRDTLFEIGSNTKHFTAALIGRLVDEGKLTFDDTVGQHLPQYPFWGDVTIRSMLDMTSPIPTYDQTMAMARIMAAEPMRHFTMEELVAIVLPGGTDPLPKNTPWFYSNTNYILAGMIVEKVSGMPYDEALRTLLFEPTGLAATVYFPVTVPDAIIDRMASGYLVNADCPNYAPGCTDNPVLPLIGSDVKRFDLSWAGPAGGIIATMPDLARWVRALFGGEVVSASSLEAMMRVVSMTTGEPIGTATAKDPRGFGLGLSAIYDEPLGTFWFYQGETLGYRVVFVWFPDSDVLITFALNSAPNGADNKVSDLITSVHALATR